jgi:hypothetical protein
MCCTKVHSFNGTYVARAGAEHDQSEVNATEDTSKQEHPVCPAVIGRELLIGPNGIIVGLMYVTVLWHVDAECDDSSPSSPLSKKQYFFITKWKPRNIVN